jgi:glycosyltransferase involved in cell wall biosynthesis
MYLLVLQVPIYVQGNDTFVTTDWKRSLLLLRDSLQDKLGEVTVFGPRLPADHESRQPRLEPLGPGDQIRLVPSIDARCQTRQYWGGERRRWSADLKPLVYSARVVHSGLDDVWRPIAFAGYVASVKAGVPTVFVQDTDIALQQRELGATQRGTARLKAEAYSAIYERFCRWGVRHASLSLLKGRALMDRYGPYAKNARRFHDTSHSLQDILSREVVTGRLRARSAGTKSPLRLVYCGRLLMRKGLSESLKVVAAGRRLGASIELDLIGDGPEREALSQEIHHLGLTDCVRFLGTRLYGPSLIEELGKYDGLLFTPVAEDTPRMIFDGYAAGLPVLGYSIPYVQERIAEDRAGVLLPLLNPEEAGRVLAELSAQPDRLRDLGFAALDAAREHASEGWYRRRAEWTFEMLDEFECAAKVVKAVRPSKSNGRAGSANEADDDLTDAHEG